MSTSTFSTPSSTNPPPLGWWRRAFGRGNTKRLDIEAALRLFAAASVRVLGQSPFASQLDAARLLAQGRAVEMQTGEGKTLAVAAAAAACALAGRHVHVATVNRYLAERDFQLFAPVLRSLGLTVGHAADDSSPAAKRAAYGAQIVYATGYTLGFDFLREQQRAAERACSPLGDNLLRRLAGDSDDQPAPLRLDFAILDEADSVLLDEATTPLVLAESQRPRHDDTVAIASAAAIAMSLNFGRHFSIDAPQRAIHLTEPGRVAVDRAAAMQPHVALARPWRQYVEQALVAAHLLHTDVDYVVADDRLKLVDMTTGRIFDDRRWPEGLQQAIEWKEQVPFSEPARGAESITRARFFRSYRTLAAISGTLVEAARELRSTFGLVVDPLSPRLPSQLVEWPTRAFGTSAARRSAVAAEAEELHRAGRPVLVGCRTIAESTAMSREFAECAIPHQLLNGIQDEAEATLIAAAGRSRTVTIATNMAGRGTDIRLDAVAKQAGGLHVIGVERNDSARIDRQLLGRAGRQGEPGSGRFFVAATDALVADQPQIVAAMLVAAAADGEVRTDYSTQWTQTQRLAELAARRRREAAEHGRSCREAAAATLLS